ncbi:hypothetical protein [Psychroserpens burtonensis]|uniref:hypothetical protein n=1 Tax=Psychroserpens burtonensis TaxID=49278 RepID=UPI000421F069|nr:hypothetical protein [Psychroserpens burtonensis]
MRNIIKILILAVLFTSCEDTEPVLFNGSTAIGFEDTVVEVSIPEEGIVSTIVVTSTTVSTESRTYDVQILPLVPGSTDTWLPLPEANLAVGVINIPAGEYTGTLALTFDNADLIDFTQYRFQVEVDLEGSAFPPVTFFVLKQFDITTFPCSDLKLSIVTDNFASETSFEITDDTGAVVESGGPYSDGTSGDEIITNISLAPGCYTLTVSDSFGDGLDDGNFQGTYNLFCAAQTVVSYASGAGNFGFEESTDFCIVE